MRPGVGVRASALSLRTPHRAAGHELHPPRDEREADETLGRIARAREDADTVNEVDAEQAWRQISRLASRCSEAHAIVSASRAASARRAATSKRRLLHCPPTAALCARTPSALSRLTPNL